MRVRVLFLLLGLAAAPSVSALEIRGGAFLQSNARTVSGGVFSGREVSFSNSGAVVWRGGGWVLRDRGETPAPAPALEAGVRFRTPFGLWGEPNIGGGYAFLVSQAFAQAGVRAGLAGSGALNRVSVQASLLFTRPHTTFLGLGFDLPF